MRILVVRQEALPGTLRRGDGVGDILLKPAMVSRRESHSE